MLILPFIHSVISNNTNSNFKVNVIKVLTIGGYTIWEEDNSLHIDNDILNPNDIYRKGASIKYDNIQLCEVDTNKTNLSEMYNWNECGLDDSTTFCWRTFYYFTNNKICWLETPNNEQIGKYTIKELIDTIIRRKLSD
jgi:hypothetical protein